MAKARNLVIRGAGGQLAIATGKGQIHIVKGKKLKANLSDLVEKRQAVGKELTKALQDAGYEVEARSHTDCVDLPENSGKKNTKK